MRFFPLAILVVFIFTNEAFATPGQISYTVNSTLNFGRIIKQTSGTVTSTIANNSGSRGEINIKDGNSGSETINITFQSCGLTGDKVRVKDFTAKYGSTRCTVTGNGPFTRTGLPNPNSSGTALQYGATIEVNSDATSGNLQPCFDITIGYDCVPSCSPPPPSPSQPFHDHANVTVFAPISLNEIQQMNFKHITKPTTNSEITMDTNGTMTVSSGNTVLLDGTGGSAGIFDIGAEKNVLINISIPNVSVVNGLGIKNMMANFNGTIKAVRTAQQFTASATGNNNLKLGATLIVRTSATNGAKTIPYNIIIDYQ